jgi:hypothetical protein
MNSWYNNTLDDTVATSVTASKHDVDWMNVNRFDANKTQYANLYIANSLVNNANFPGIASYAYARNIKLGLAYSAASQVDFMLNYNKGKTIDQKLWFAVSEIEPYNTGNYTGMTTILKNVYPKLKAAGMPNVVYMGWPTDSYWSTLVQYCDQINLHCYLASSRMTPSGIWGYVRGRLELIAQAAKAQNKIMPVNIIYSCEPDFAYDYFKTNTWASAQSMFLAQYAANASANMRQHLTVYDFSVFVSKYGKQIKPI